LKVDDKHVAVIGGGVTGLTAAHELARMGIRVSLFEKTPFLGGYAVQLNCKATDACVKCGACVAEETLIAATGHPNVRAYTGAEVESVSGTGPFQFAYRLHAPLVNAERCDGCGLCFQKCPVSGAIDNGRTPNAGPRIAIRRDLCRYFDDTSCTLCRDACPQGAIELSSQARPGTLRADAILMATGFTTYDPVDKPYGYGQFQNVITSLDAERLLGAQMMLQRPSDGRTVKRMAFIQCVGSRDAKLGHSWCSKVCCGSSLRMARLIQSRQKGIQISFFYIDVQTFGKDFEAFYRDARENIEMIRAIPADIIETAQDRLEVVYFDPESRKSREELYDVVVLSVGLLPSVETGRIAQMLNWSPDESGFLPPHDSTHHPTPEGIFAAGAVGPMSIAESVGRAEKTAWDMARYLGCLKIS